jgi:hypothetical protein
MTDDALSKLWVSNGRIEEDQLHATVHATLEEHRAIRHREVAARIGLIGVLGVLFPVLVWFAAYGRTPAVRGGYALMAAGAAVAVFTEWVYLSWARQCDPRSIDTRSQLLNNAAILFRQVWLLRAAAFSTAPLFVGTALVGSWMYQHSSHTTGYVWWTGVVIGWAFVGLGSRAKAAELEKRRKGIEKLLRDMDDR